MDCEAEQEAGSERLSGSEVVMWTADTEATGATADATAETTLTFQPDGTLDRSTSPSGSTRCSPSSVTTRSGP